MTHTHKSYAQHVDVVFYPANIRVEEVRHHTGLGASNKMDSLAEYGGIRNRKPLLPLAIIVRCPKATHPSRAQTRPEGRVAESRIEFVIKLSIVSSGSVGATTLQHRRLIYTRHTRPFLVQIRGSNGPPPNLTPVIRLPRLVGIANLIG